MQRMYYSSVVTCPRSVVANHRMPASLQAFAHAGLDLSGRWRRRVPGAVLGEGGQLPEEGLGRGLLFPGRGAWGRWCGMGWQRVACVVGGAGGGMLAWSTLVESRRIMNDSQGMHPTRVVLLRVLE